MSGKGDANINFSDLCNLLSRLGFRERIRGSHHVFVRSNLREIIDIQSLPDGKAKPYQVKQIRDLFRLYTITQAP